MSAFHPHQPVFWLHEPRGGYGYIIPVPAVVEKVGPARVTIRALKQDGTWVKRVVRAERLRGRREEKGDG